MMALMSNILIHTYIAWLHGIIYLEVLIDGLVMHDSLLILFLFSTKLYRVLYDRANERKSNPIRPSAQHFRTPGGVIDSR